MPSSCGCGCGAFVAKKGLFTKGCAKRLGTVCDPRGVQKAANAINNPIYGPIHNAARAAARPALAKSDAEPGLAKIVRYSPEYLRTVVAIALRRPEIQLLWASGSRHFTYWFFWTCEVAAGWRATAEQLASAERRESTKTMCSSSNPVLMVSVPAWAGNCRALLHSDIHFSGSPARIIRVAIGLRVDELAEIEREGCRLTRRRTLGFAGNRKDGGTCTAPKEGNIHGVSVLVIDDLAALGIVLAQPFAPAYAARALLGSEPAVTPPPPSTFFEPPPCEASGAFVLGGSHFLALRGLSSGGSSGAGAGGSAGGTAGGGLPPLPWVLQDAGGEDDDDDDSDGVGGGNGGGMQLLPPPQARPMCKFGASCYRKNILHLLAFDHPAAPAADAKDDASYAVGGGGVGMPPPPRAATPPPSQQVHVPGSAPRSVSPELKGGMKTSAKRLPPPAWDEDDDDDFK